MTWAISSAAGCCSVDRNASQPIALFRVASAAPGAALLSGSRSLGCQFRLLAEFPVITDAGEAKLQKALPDCKIVVSRLRPTSHSGLHIFPGFSAGKQEAQKQSAIKGSMLGEPHARTRDD